MGVKNLICMDIYIKLIICDTFGKAVAKKKWRKTQKILQGMKEVLFHSLHCAMIFQRVDDQTMHCCSLSAFLGSVSTLGDFRCLQDAA